MKRIPKNGGLVDVVALRKRLTIPNGAHWQAEQSGVASDLPTHVELFTEDSDYIYIPRHCKVSYTTKPLVIRELQMYPQVPTIEHNILLRDDIQKEAAASLLANEEDKILCLSCGRGKTICTLYAASQGNRFPLLIVVHTNALMDQWRERILQFYKIPSKSVGHIQATVEDWRGKSVAIAMLHSLVLKKYPPEFYQHWKLVIFDETHRLGSELFRKAAPMFNAERWGLTATLQRTDGMESVIRAHLGKVAYSNLTQELKSDVFFVDTGMSFVTKNKRGGRPNLARLQNDLSESRERNDMVLSYINKAAEKGRTILVLGERVGQAYELWDRCKASSKSVHVGEMGQEERREALTKQVVFATQHLAKEGLDRAEFDTLVILIPFSGPGRLQQSVGRIERTLDGKKQPMVLIFTDNNGFVKSMEKKMRNWFRANGYKIKNVESKT